MSLYSFIEQSRLQNRKLLAILLDPEKVDCSCLSQLTDVADMLFIGGSTGTGATELVRTLRKLTSKPLVLFPGQVSQFTPEADALLFLSLLSSRNPDVLIGRQLAVARQVAESGVESIPMGYILIDGGCVSSVAKASSSAPLPANDLTTIVDTAIVAELLGKKLVYLEAGSGAANPVAPDTIRAVRNRLHIPLIVGGGIVSPDQMNRAFRAGADVVVIGNHFEHHPEQAPLFKIQYQSL